MKRHLAVVIATFVVALLTGTGAVRAATIDSISLFSLPGFSTGAVGPFGVTPAPNNDDAGAVNPNVIAYTGIFLNSPGLFEAEVVLGDSGGTTEYRITQQIINNSGVVWSGFQFELGFGTGASFVRSSLPDALDFDAPDATAPPTAVGFSTLVHDDDVIDWTGGVVPSIGFSGFTFAIDVPDHLELFNPYGLNRFTLRQTPNPPPPVPVSEPATLLLMGVALTAAAAWWRPTRN